MVGVRSAELMDTSVLPLNHFYYTDEVNDVPGIGNLASRYTSKKKQPSTRLLAPVLPAEPVESVESVESVEPAEPARAYSSCMGSNYFLLTIILILIMSKQYAILSALLAAAWASYAIVYAVRPPKA